MHTPHGDAALRASLDLLDLRLPADVRAALARLRRDLRDRQGERARRRRAATARSGSRPTAARSPRRSSSTPSAGAGCSPPATATSPPTRRSRAASRCIPAGSGEDLEIWIDRRYVPAGYGWSFPAEDELRIGIGSFDPRFHVKDTTVLLTEDLGKEPNEYQGNWIPHKLRRATEGGIFFAGDSAGHCLPLSAEGIRTALYFGIALGRELRARGRGPAEPRGGRRRLRRVQRLARVEVPLDAVGAEADPADPAAPAGPDDPPDGLEALRPLVLRPLPADRPSRLRRAQRTTRTVPASSRATPITRCGAERDLVKAEQAEAVDQHRGGELAGDRRRGDPAGADHRDGDQRVGHVDGAEQAAEQVVPADVEGRAEAAGLAAEDDDRGQRDRADGEGDAAPPEGCRSTCRARR